MNSAYGENEYSILRQVLGLLYRNNDFDAAVNDVLELLGKTYQVSRVYIIEDNAEHTACSNTFEWCALGIQSEMAALQNLVYGLDLEADYQDHFDA